LPAAAAGARQNAEVEPALSLGWLESALPLALGDDRPGYLGSGSFGGRWATISD
jgi:hypothetical protein